MQNRLTSTEFGVMSKSKLLFATPDDRPACWMVVLDIWCRDRSHFGFWWSPWERFLVLIAAPRRLAIPQLSLKGLEKGLFAPLGALRVRQ